MKGKKYDEGKPRYSLLPTKSLREIVRVLTYGAEKYADNNWKLVEDAHDRYISAAIRHIEAYREGDVLDSETSFHNLAHAACCLMFLAELDMQHDNEVSDFDCMG